MYTMKKMKFIYPPFIPYTPLSLNNHHHSIWLQNYIKNHKKYHFSK